MALPQFLKLYASNDFAAMIRLVEVESPSGVVVDVEDGTVTGFLSVSDDVEVAAIAHASLSVTFTYSGDGGWWLATMDATLLSPTLLRATFPTDECFLFATRSGDIKGSVKCKLQYTNPMTVSA